MQLGAHQINDDDIVIKVFGNKMKYKTEKMEKNEKIKMKKIKRENTCGRLALCICNKS